MRDGSADLRLYVIIEGGKVTKGRDEMEIARKFYIMTASIGTGHSQAARAIAEAIQRTHPSDSVQVLDFVSSNLFSIDHIIKDGYLKMIDVFPEMYDHLYSDSQMSRFGQFSQKMLSLSFKRRMKNLIMATKPDAMIFTHPFPGRSSRPFEGGGLDLDPAARCDHGFRYPPALDRPLS